MAGVPVTAEALHPDAATRLGSDLAATLISPVAIEDPLRREEHSVRLRRSALLGHSTLAWRARLAARAGLPHRSFPTCTIVLATRREDQLPFALRQVARQRVADLELVVVTHGFSPDPAMVADLAGHSTTLVPMPAEACFGDVLNAGVTAASGDLVLKMDDDDWYGRDHVADLLLARHYSGADVVGTTAEFVYLHDRDLTVRRVETSERTARFIAGGTIMIERGRLNELGAFRRSRRHLDGSLLASVHAAGGTVYRTHGLGYVLARRSSGHTWEVDLDFFLEPGRLSDRWSGFTPSRLLDPDDVDLPR
jgi:glycosyltransferase involved in cell wall biosynthesis